jgi:LmbE family N-acetylglucosaminyl deacetylase
VSTTVFFHAHPDDESIFTGGTIRRLADRGDRAVVVLATGTAERRAEAERACAALGVSALRWLDYHDSGLHGEAPGDTFVNAPIEEAAHRLAGILAEEHADALVVYDPGGIYGHPDHIAVHRVGRIAAQLAGTTTVYECTVDREYLHFVETHLVGHAVESLLGVEVGATNAAPLGVPTVLVDLTIDVRAQRDAKRAAMAAHASQISVDSETLTMTDDTFNGVYGFEWYMRTSGPRGPLEEFAF